MILVIDNYDSFTYNLVQQMGALGAEMCVVRNDEITVKEAQAMAPDRVVISPGPGTPDDSGVSLDIIRQMGPSTPVLGVCLGHQGIGQVFGGEVIRAPKLMHGKTSQVRHKGDALFSGVPSPFTATRYHSLIVKEPLPDCLRATATSEDGELMAMRHVESPIFGVQFHPESVLTSFGTHIVRNFLEGMF